MLTIPHGDFFNYSQLFTVSQIDPSKIIWKFNEN